jgi:hypothetical protein
MTDYDWTGWTDWTPLSTLDFKTVPADPGAYVVATDKPICRAIGTDLLGFLDVGETDGLRKRLKDFKPLPDKARRRRAHGGLAFRLLPFRTPLPHVVAAGSLGNGGNKGNCVRGRGSPAVTLHQAALRTASVELQVQLE